MNDVAKEAGRPLYARGSWNTHLLIEAKRPVHISLVAGNRVCQAHGILQSLARPLGNMLEHRVRGIAKQRDVMACPVVGGEPVVEWPAPVTFHSGQGSLHALVRLSKMR